ncbi:MAG TPA: DEAD/DEAH box helicase [Terriglobales bacterium]|nr:DEAD/DEAH box helicase [Terriglobales bacterium]
MSSAVHRALGWAHPVVAEWFLRRFGSPTEPQEQGWPEILAGRTTLIAAPTGSGKTLAAFLACIDRLVRKALAGQLEDRTEVLYVSPLKALGNDIQKNLEIPLGEILQLAGEHGLLMPEIRTAVRTGDTLMHERQKMLRRPPHILVTTPESLYILLTAEKSRRILRDVETVIVDEIHAVAGDKRGAHLLLSLERLEAVTGKSPVRIGLSATQKPIEQIAEFLNGSERPSPVIVDVGHKRELDLAIEVPPMELGPVATNEMWDAIYDRIAELSREHRSTLVFVNTRRQAERVSMNLAERIGEQFVAAHHGSLARKIRLEAERRLKNGEIKVLVATASLQLGIDIGFVDLVCQIESPRSIAVALQRIGRAGHWRGAIPKGKLFATTREQLAELAALVRGIKHSDLDRILVPACPIDVLAQQIVAECAAASGHAPANGDGSGVDLSGWDEDELFALIKRAYPYRGLSREEYDSVLEMLSEGIAARRGRYGAYLHRDRVNRRLRARRGARMTAITSGGAIPETALYTVVLMPEGTMIGTVDEDYAVESLAGDVMLLGNASWRIQRIESKSGRILVEDAHGQAPNIPFWRGEAPSRTAELSSLVADLRQRVSDMLPNVSPIGLSQSNPVVAEAAAWLKSECGLDDAAAEQIIQHFLNGRAVLGAVPTQKTIIAERFFDEGGGMQLVIHAPFGGRINKAWGLALRKRFCRSFNFELQAAATDEGLNISLAEQHSFPLEDVFRFLQSETVKNVLQQAALTGSPIFGTRWRWDANRSLALLRYQGGKKVPPNIQRMRADDLLASVFPDVAACQENIVGDIQVPDHPLVKEVMKDVLHEAMDVDGLIQLLRGIESGSIRCLAVDTPVPSEFSHEILNANPYAYLDDAPLEERRARAVSMRQALPASVLEEVGKLDPGAIAQVREEAWPDLRDADELHDALFTLVAVPENYPFPGDLNESGPRTVQDMWRRYFDHLTLQRRAVIAEQSGIRFWVAVERLSVFKTIHPEAIIEGPGREIRGAEVSRSDAIYSAVTGWMSHLGPASAAGIAVVLALMEPEVEQALLRLESTGAILRGKFTDRRTASSAGSLNINDHRVTTEFCERRLLARIHRLTIGILRREIEPVMPAQFMRWLLRWQHVAQGSQVVGERGLLESLRQLQGFEIPANAWERQILTRRVRDYDPTDMDKLCLTGAIGWGRLSPHPATVESSANSNGDGQRTRRVIPTSVAPITFFLRDEADWMQPHHTASNGSDRPGLSEGAKQVFNFLHERGASFFVDVVRGTGKLKAEAETALWELVAAGLVTADGFDNLRSLIDPKRRSGQGGGRSSRPRHSAGRWSLLHPVFSEDRNRTVEATCWMLLRRYGIVFRELLARESMLPKWRELVMAFRRLEDRGEIRGGRFVQGFIGEQFALPAAVESLRAIRRLEPSCETVTVSAADPLNLVGIIVPGERVAAISGRTVTYNDGVPVATEVPSLPTVINGD